MTDIQMKSQETRQKNQEAKAALYQERANATRAARQALQHVFELEDATPAEILRAAELLTKLSESYRC